MAHQLDIGIMDRLLAVRSYALLECLKWVVINLCVSAIHNLLLLPAILTG